MSEVKTAKLFRNGGSQAVRLPAEFRFEGDIVYIRPGERAGDVILSEAPPEKTLKDFYDRVGYLEEEIEFMEERPLNRVWKIKNPFLDDDEDTGSEGRNV